MELEVNTHNEYYRSEVNIHLLSKKQQNNNNNKKRMKEKINEVIKPK